MRGGNVLGCVAGMCWDAWWECAGMRGRNVLGCVAGMCCKMRARNWDESVQKVLH